MNLKELAQTLGLSQTTVSRALNGYPEVSEKTRERVMEAAHAAHYSPSGRARSLATGRTMTIGHVIPVSAQHEMVNPVFGDFIAGAGEVYSANGYEMLINLAPDDQEADVYREMHAKGQVDGLVVHGPRVADPRISLLNDLGLPFVVHGRASEANADYAWLDVNNTRAFQIATRHLIALGHHRIGLINGLEALDFAHRRRVGYETALSEAGIRVDADLMRSADMTESHGYASTKAMLTLPDPPTAFVVASIITALGVQRAAAEAGLILGKDLSLVSYDDDLSYLRNGAPDGAIITAMRSSVRDAGRRVAHMLLERIAAPSLPPRHEMMEALLVQGETTGPCPALAAP